MPDLCNFIPGKSNGALLPMQISFTRFMVLTYFGAATLSFLVYSKFHSVVTKSCATTSGKTGYTNPVWSVGQYPTGLQHFLHGFLHEYMEYG